MNARRFSYEDRGAEILITYDLKEKGLRERVLTAIFKAFAENAHLASGNGNENPHLWLATDQIADHYIRKQPRPGQHALEAGLVEEQGQRCLWEIGLVIFEGLGGKLVLPKHRNRTGQRSFEQLLERAAAILDQDSVIRSFHELRPKEPKESSDSRTLLVSW